MGRPEKACGNCDWYVPGHQDIDFGVCFRKEERVCANQTACISYFEPGTPCISKLEAKHKWVVRCLKYISKNINEWSNLSKDDFAYHIKTGIRLILESIDDDR